MLLVFIFIALGVGLIGTFMLVSTGNTDKNLASPRAYAMNMMEWHQAAMLVAADVEPVSSTIELPACRMANAGWSSNSSWVETKPCALIIPPNNTNAITNSIDNRLKSGASATNSAYMKLEDWQSYYYKVSNNEAYVITLYLNSANANGSYLTPAYVAEGLKSNMGFDRSGVGIVRGTCSASSPPGCIAEFSPIVTEAGLPDNPVPIYFGTSLPIQSQTSFTAAGIGGAAGIMTRVR